jgi:hypothetical protein
MSCSGIFYFLWGDWLFADLPVQENFPSTIQDRDLRRNVVLQAIADYNERCQKTLGEIQSLRASLTGVEQLFFKAFWELLHLRESADPATVERLMIDRRVNELDPDFSFESAVQAMLKQDRSS